MTNTINTINTRFSTLVTALRADADKCDLIEDVKDTVDACCGYVEQVDNMAESIQLARATMDAEDFRRYAQNLDFNRRAAHEGLMINVDMLNRICVNLGIPLVADVDEDNRESYYAFAKKVAEATKLGEFCEW